MKSFFQLSLEVVASTPDVCDTFRQKGLSMHIEKLRKILNEIHCTQKKEKKENLRIYLAEIAEPALKTLVLAENTYYYRKFLKAKMPELCEKYKNIAEIEDFDPPLLYESFLNADRGIASNFIEEFFIDIFGNIRWTPTTTHRITSIFTTALKTINLLKRIDDIAKNTLYTENMAKKFLEIANSLKKDLRNYE